MVIPVWRTATGARVTLNDASAITGNWDGVDNDSGTLTLNDGSRISRQLLGGVDQLVERLTRRVVLVNGSARITSNGRYRGIEG